MQVTEMTPIFAAILFASMGLAFSHYWKMKIDPWLTARRKARKLRMGAQRLRAKELTSGNRTVHVNSLWSDK